MPVPSGAPTSRTDAVAPPSMRISVAESWPRGARAEHEVRHRRDARQRFAAEPQRPDRAEILRPGDLARRVPFDGKARVLGLHPLAIVLDANELLAAELDSDLDATSRPASSAFSTSSLTTDAGRSTTSPAAIWLARCSGKPVDARHVRSSVLACGRTRACIAAEIDEHEPSNPRRTASAPRPEMRQLDVHARTAR